MKKIEVRMIAPIMLFFFMLFCFGPTEIYYANKTEFDFSYADYIGMGVFALIICTALFSLLLMVKKMDTFVIVSFFTLDILTYLQVMFFNKGMDLVGVTPEFGYVAPYKKYFSLVVYVVVFTVNLLMTIKIESYKKIVCGVSAFLILIQLIAGISILPTILEYDYNRDVLCMDNKIFRW